LPAATAEDGLHGQDGLHQEPSAQSVAVEKPITNIFAWIMAAVPLLVPLVDIGLPRVFGIELNTHLVNAAFVLIYMAIGLTDANRIEASGRNVRRIHLRAWAVLFPPVYFIQRARALGQSFVLFFAWLGAAVTSIALNIFFLWGVYWVTGSLPGCHTPFTATRAKAVFESLRNNAGLPLGRALDVGNVVEKTATDKLVSCEATIRASDARIYYVIIVHEWQGSQIYTKLGVYAVH